MYTQRKEPCPQCPYVKSTPPGIWHQDEYEKLPKYDRCDGFSIPDTSVFHCHHTNDKKDIICQGWLDCHGADQLLGMRLAYAKGNIPPGFDYEPSGADVFASGKEAMEFGISEIEEPSDGAEAAITRLGKMKRIKDHPK